MTGTIGTMALVCSPRRLPSTAKNWLLWRRASRDPEAMALWNRYFNGDEYRLNHEDVLRAGIAPLVHFLLRGNEESRNPSAGFNTREYLNRYPEVAASGINALLHFVCFGRREGRTLSEPVDTPVDAPASAAIVVNNLWRRDWPLVSVVIPCFNYGRFVEQAIRSVLGQTFTDFEIVVVEGGSTDASTVAEVRRLEALGLPNTRFFFRSERHLAGDNRNYGIGFARGRYICCLDADDMLRPVFLEAAVFLAELFGYDLVTPAVQCFGKSDLRWLIPDPSFPAILGENQVATAALFRRAAWAHVGGFRDWGIGAEHLPEDWDFWIRFLGHGFSGAALRDTLLLYRVHEGSLSNNSVPELHRQRELLQAANADLQLEPAVPAGPRRVLNPWANLLGSPREEAASSGEINGFLLALPFVTIGGAEKLLRILAEHVVARGRRLVVVTSIELPESVPDDLASFESITPHVYRLPRLFSGDAIRRSFLRYLVRRYSLQTLMVVGCEFVYHSLPELKAEFPDLTVIDQLFNDFGHVANNRKYSDAIDATIVPSDALRLSLIERHGAGPSSVHVIPHGTPAPEASEARPDLPAISQGKILVGFFGRLSSEKAPDIFVEIVRRLAKIDDLFFVMTGEGPERENVLERIRKYRLQDRIYAPGFVENVHPLLRAADIIVVPSRIDGMPLVVLEAQALGKPVVASRLGSIPVMIEDRQSGFLCEVEDISAFCECIRRLARDSELRRRMGLAGQARVARDFSTERMLQRYDDVLWRDVTVKACGVL